MGLRIAYLCMESVFSVRPLEALLAAGHDVRFVLRPLGPLSTRNDPVLKRHRGFDIAMRRLLGLNVEEHRTNPLAVAADRDIPAWLCGSANTPMVRQLLTKERIDLIVVAFFNQLLSANTIAAAPLGAVNMHPSLLPHHRGPAPLFWTFKDGDDVGGLTLHRIAPGEDDGSIVSATPLPLPFGLSGEDLVDQLAELAGAEVCNAVARLAAGEQGTAQDHDLATRAPRPGPADVVIDGSQSAKRIFTFARGVGRWNNLVVHAGGDVLRVLDAVEVDDSRQLPGELVLIGDDLLLGTTDGVVRLKIRRLTS
jgi:methionyl-tRNA formyltransferase